MNRLYHKLLLWIQHNHNQTQSHDDSTNPHRSHAINISQDDNVQIEDSEGVTKDFIDNNVNVPYFTTCL